MNNNKKNSDRPVLLEALSLFSEMIAMHSFLESY